MKYVKKKKFIFLGNLLEKTFQNNEIASKIKFPNFAKIINLNNTSMNITVIYMYLLSQSIQLFWKRFSKIIPVMWPWPEYTLWGKIERKLNELEGRPWILTSCQVLLISLHCLRRR